MFKWKRGFVWNFRSHCLSSYRCSAEFLLASICRPREAEKDDSDQILTFRSILSIFSTHFDPFKVLSSKWWLHREFPWPEDFSVNRFESVDRGDSLNSIRYFQFYFLRLFFSFIFWDFSFLLERQFIGNSLFASSFRFTRVL